MWRMDHADTTFSALIEDEMADEDFREEWLRLAPARQFAVMLIGYRADHELSQRELGQVLGVSQPRVARLESGEQNPDFETIIATVGALGTEFCIDVAPASSGATLLTKSARTHGALVRHGDVSVVTASTPRSSRRPRRGARAA